MPLGVACNDYRLPRFAPEAILLEGGLLSDAKGILPDGTTRGLPQFPRRFWRA